MELVELREALVRRCIDDARDAAKRRGEDFPDDLEQRVREAATAGANACITVSAGGTGKEILGQVVGKMRALRDRKEDLVLDQVIASLRNAQLDGIRFLLDTAQGVR